VAQKTLGSHTAKGKPWKENINNGRLRRQARLIRDEGRLERLNIKTLEVLERENNKLFWFLCFCLIQPNEFLFFNNSHLYRRNVQVWL
jgi:hypothetical protein